MAKKIAILFSIMIGGASLAQANIIYGEGGEPFTEENWTVSGSVVMTPESIGLPNIAIEWPGSGGSVKGHFWGYCQGVKILLRLEDDLLAPMAIEIQDSNFGQRGSLTYFDGADATGVFRLGDCSIPPTTEVELYLWLDPVSGMMEQKLNGCETSQPINSNPTIVNPIIFNFQVGGFGISVQMVRVEFIGEQVVPAKGTAWGSLKALYR